MRRDRSLGLGPDVGQSGATWLPAGVRAPAGAQTPALFGAGAPHDATTIANWQAQLDRAVGHRPRLSRLVLRWEAGDPWEPLGRYVLWQGLDPRFAQVEPWLIAAVRGPNPRSRGHWCGDGFCACAVKRDRWVGGASRLIDAATWRLYQETGLIASRWWVIQGEHGGHRFQLDREADALEVQLRALRKLPPDTPSVGDLPYAPFDQRVLDAIQRYRRLAVCFRALDHAERTGRAMDREEVVQAEQAAKALWDWTGEQAEQHWHEGAEMIPRYLEETFGRIPVHLKAEIAKRTDPEAIEREFLTPGA